MKSAACMLDLKTTCSNPAACLNNGCDLALPHTPAVEVVTDPAKIAEAFERDAAPKTIESRQSPESLVREINARDLRHRKGWRASEMDALDAAHHLQDEAAELVEAVASKGGADVLEELADTLGCILQVAHRYDFTREELDAECVRKLRLRFEFPDFCQDCVTLGPDCAKHPFPSSRKDPEHPGHDEAEPAPCGHSDCGDFCRDEDPLATEVISLRASKVALEQKIADITANALELLSVEQSRRRKAEERVRELEAYVAKALPIIEGGSALRQSFVERAEAAEQKIEAVRAAADRLRAFKMTGHVGPLYCAGYTEACQHAAGHIDAALDSVVDEAMIQAAARPEDGGTSY